MSGSPDRSTAVIADGLVGGTPLAGVGFTHLEPHADGRGVFTEVHCAHWDAGIEPAQWSVVRSNSGAFRGMHLHFRHDEYVMAVSGRLSAGLYDARLGSPTEGRWARYELSDERPAFLCFPRGLVHGLLFHEPSTHLQAVSEASEFYRSDDNAGCHWSDPALGIEWPFEPTIVSERQQHFPPLAEMLKRRP